MTTAAWVMMLGTWSVVIFFALRFLLLAMRTKRAPDAADTDGEASSKDVEAQGSGPDPKG